MSNLCDVAGLGEAGPQLGRDSLLWGNTGHVEMDGKVDDVENTPIKSRRNLLVDTLRVAAHPLDVSLEKPRPEFPVSVHQLESPGGSGGEGGLH